jgi:hypothetical protein
MDSEAVEQLLTEAAALLDADELTQFEHKEWLFFFEDNIEIDITYDAIMQRLVVCCDVSLFPVHNKLDILEFLLSYNYIWTAHGGVRTAMDKERKQVALLLDIPLSVLSVQFFVTIVENFIELVKSLRIVCKKTTQSSIPSVDQRQFVMNSFIRG